MTELFVGAALSNFDKSQSFEARYNLVRLQHRQFSHCQAT